MLRLYSRLARTELAVGAWIVAAIALAPLAEFYLRGKLGGNAAQAGVTGALLAGTLAAVLLARRAGWAYRGSAAGAWLAAWLGLSLVSAAYNRGFAASFPGISIVSLACLAFFLGSLSFGRALRGGARFLTAGLLFGGAASAAFAVWQLVAGPVDANSLLAGIQRMSPEAARMIEARVAQGRAFAFFLYPNVLAGFLILCVPLAMERAAIAARAGRHPAAAGYAGLGILLGAGIFASGSLGAAAALLAGAIVALAVARPFGLRGSVIVVAVPALLAAGAVCMRGYGGFLDEARSKLAHWSSAAASARGPGEILLGRGPGSYGAAVGHGLPESMRSRHAHNWFVEIYVETGLCGVAVLAGLLLAAGRSCIARLRDKGKGSWGLGLAWLAWLAHSLVDFGYAVPVLVFPFWMIGGQLALGAAPAGRRRRISRRLGADGGLRVWRVAAAGAGTAFLFLPLLRGKESALALGCLLGIAAAAGVWRALANPGRVPFRPAPDWPWLALLGIGVFWIAASPAPAVTYGVVLEGAGLFALLMLSRSIAVYGGARSEGTIRFWIIAGVSLYAAWAALEGLVGQEPGRASFPSPNLLAAYLVGGLGVCLGTLTMISARRRPYAAIATALTAAGILATRSLGGVLSGSALFAVWLVLGTRREGRGFKIAGAGAVIGLAALSLLPALDSLSVSQRLAMWEEGLELLVANPEGIGPGRYAAGAELVRKPSVTAAGVGRYSLRAEFAHSDPLQFAVEWGLPALLVMGWGLLYLFSRARGREAAPWFWALAGLLLYSFLDFPLRVPVCKALAAVALGMLSARSGGVPSRRARTAPRRFFGGRALIAAVAVIPALAMLRPSLARWQMAQAGAGPWADIELAERVRAVSPLSPSAYALEGMAYWRLFELVEPPNRQIAWLAERSLLAARDLGGGDPEAGVSLGYFYLLSGERLRDRERPERAREAFARAAESAPTRPHPWLGIARSHAAERSYDEAAAAIAQARRREPFFLEALAEEGLIAQKAGDPGTARRAYRTALLLRAHLLQRKDLNDYERALCRLDEEDVKGRLLDLGTAP